MASDQDEDDKDLQDDASAEDEVSHADTSHVVATEEESHVDSHVDDERSMDTTPYHDDDEDDVEEDDDDDDEEEDDDNDGTGANRKLAMASGGTADETKKSAPNNSSVPDGTPSTAITTSTTTTTKKKRRVIPPSARRGRAPAVKGLTIPFRTVKKAMKLDPDIPIVQNEAAIMTTMAAELFLQSLARESQQIAKNRGRNTIRYEDVAEARSNNSSLAFLQTLIP